MKKAFLLGLFSILLISCNHEVGLFSDFEKKSPAWTKYYPDNIFNPSSSRFIYFQDRLYWIEYTRDEFIYSMDLLPGLNSSVYNHNVKKGRGPDEFMMVLSIKRVNGHFSFVDSFKGSFHIVKGDSIFNELTVESVKPFDIQQMVKVRDNRYLYTGFLNDARFILVDSEQNILSKYSHFPGRTGDLPYLKVEKNMGCVNVITSNGNSFANIIYDTGIIEFFKVDGDSIECVNEIIYSDNEFSIIKSDGATRVTRSDGNTGFVDICSDSEFVYALYSSVSIKDNKNLSAFGDYILVYTLEGEPKLVLELEIPLRGFSSVPELNELWGWGHDSMGMYIVNYEIN